MTFYSTFTRCFLISFWETCRSWRRNGSWRLSKKPSRRKARSTTFYSWACWQEENTKSSRKKMTLTQDPKPNERSQPPASGKFRSRFWRWPTSTKSRRCSTTSRNYRDINPRRKSIWTKWWSSFWTATSPCGLKHRQDSWLRTRPCFLIANAMLLLRFRTCVRRP